MSEQRSEAQQRFDDDFAAIKRTPAYRRRVRAARSEARMIRLGKVLIWIKERCSWTERAES